MSNPSPDVTQSTGSPELRIDPLTGLKTIVATERSQRPAASFTSATRPAVDVETDPFLEGHEHKTPPELYALRSETSMPNGPGWRVRVVENLYPALADGEPLDAATNAPPALSPQRPADAADPLATGRSDPDLFSARRAAGAHEVIVNGPEPVSSLADLEVGQLEAAMDVWRRRMSVHSDAAYVHVTVNEGLEAGASLAHTHAQLYALAFVPQAIARERERFTAYANRTQGRNLLEDLLQEEVRLRARLVAVDPEAVAICPFAAQVPFQIQIIPRKPRPRFEGEGALASGLLADSLRRLKELFGDVPDFNLWVRTAPRDADHFCWRIDVLPRLARIAGLELGTGVSLNVVAPEYAARLLRDAGQ